MATLMRLVLTPGNAGDGTKVDGEGPGAGGGGVGAGGVGAGGGRLHVEPAASMKAPFVQVNDADPVVGAPVSLSNPVDAP